VIFPEILDLNLFRLNNDKDKLKFGNETNRFFIFFSKVEMLLFQPDYSFKSACPLISYNMGLVSQPTVPLLA